MVSQRKQHLTVLLTVVCLLAMGSSVLLAQQPILPPTPTTIQQPVITALHPSSAKAGSGPIAVFVTGQNFLRGFSSVQFGGSERPTSVFNSEVLVFELTKADLAEPKTAMVKVLTKTQNESLTSNSIAFEVLPNEHAPVLLEMALLEDLSSRAIYVLNSRVLW